ncbi:MAG: UvrD-helicase domain-containing protein, partial [Proteobacteria bacterium]|nr:UvrD-helicase domain-containing protein [Pseudomonadota bacterium]
ELQKAFDHAAAQAGPSRLRETFETIFDNLQKWEKFFAQYPSTASFEQALCRQLNLDDTPEEEAYLASLCRAPEVNEASLKLLAKTFSETSKLEQDAARKMTPWLENMEARVGGFEEYAGAFLTQKFLRNKKLPTDGTRKKYPDIAALFDQEADRVEAIMHRLLVLRFLKKQAAWRRLFAHLWQQLQATKAAQAALTYEDLILRTRALLKKRGLCEWVLYKLDGGIDHLLVDEAQDTSPAQWDILFALLDEFLSGKGARMEPRVSANHLMSSFGRRL